MIYNLDLCTGATLACQSLGCGGAPSISGVAPGLGKAKFVYAFCV